MLVEVIFTSRVAGHKIGDIAEYDEHTLLFKALVNGHHVEILNPPWWPETPKEVLSDAVPNNNQSHTNSQSRVLPRSPAGNSREGQKGAGDGKKGGSKGYG